MNRPFHSFTIATILLATILFAAGVASAQDSRVPTKATTAETPVAEDATECRGRRSRALEALPEDAILLVLAEGPADGYTGMVRSDDFLYLTGMNAPGSVVLLHRPTGENAAPVQRIYLRPRAPAMERWTGPKPGPGQVTATTQLFDEALPIARLAPDLASLLVTDRELLVSAASPADGRRSLDTLLERVQALLPDGIALRREDTRRRRVEDEPPAQHASPIRRVRSGTRLLTDLRATKSPTEIERIRRAVNATVEGIRDALRFARPGVAEYQLAAIVEFRCKTAGCARQAFDSIAGSGPNSCILHYGANDRVTEDGDLVVLDVGGEFRGYAADVTRTFPVNGKFTDAQAKVYDAVLEAQLAALAAVKPGVTLRDVHAAAKAVLDRHELGQYFIHGTSHSVGLNVHDPFGRGRTLEVGSVLTVEPGAYLAHEALGVRIEDTVVVTENGHENLSAGAPKTRAEIEALMRETPPLDVPLPR